MAWYRRDKRLSDFSVEKTLRILRLEGVDCKEVSTKGYDIQLSDGRKVEVKFDTWIASTGNISAEWWVDESKKIPGWAQYSDADIMVYMYDFDNAYVIDMQRLKSYVKDNYNSLRNKPAYKNTAVVNKMVPISQVPDLRIRQFEDMFTRHAVLPRKD